jgi:hypothetical protein
LIYHSFIAIGSYMLMQNNNHLARLHYSGNGFRVLAPGDHVLCAVSGLPVALDALKYWSVTRQEAYASAQHSVTAFLTAHAAEPSAG